MQMYVYPHVLTAVSRTGIRSGVILAVWETNRCSTGSDSQSGYLKK